MNLCTLCGLVGTVMALMGASGNTYKVTALKGRGNWWNLVMMKGRPVAV